MKNSLPLGYNALENPQPYAPFHMIDNGQPSSADTHSGGDLLSLPIYPFNGNGIWLLIAGSFLFWLAHLAICFWPLALLIGSFETIYVLAFFPSIISSTTNSEDEIPNWPDVTYLWSDILRLMFMLLIPVVLCVLPASLYDGYTSRGPAAPGPNPTISRVLRPRARTS